MAASDDIRFDPFDIVVVPFPYADRLAEKRRPALVISNRKLAAHGLVWVAMITSAENEPWRATLRLRISSGRVACAVCGQAGKDCVHRAKPDRPSHRPDRQGHRTHRETEAARIFRVRHRAIFVGLKRDDRYFVRSAPLSPLLIRTFSRYLPAQIYTSLKMCRWTRW